MQTVVETKPFTAQAADLLTDEEKAELIDALASDPAAGTLIPGTGGVRKLRIPLLGRGKRGGARVVYFFHDEDLPVYALLLFAKNERTDMTSAQKKAVRQFAEAIKATRRK